MSSNGEDISLPTWLYKKCHIALFTFTESDSSLVGNPTIVTAAPTPPELCKGPQDASAAPNIQETPAAHTGYGIELSTRPLEI